VYRERAIRGDFPLGPSEGDVDRFGSRLQGARPLSSATPLHVSTATGDIVT
jgi:hypothetical protein